MWPASAAVAARTPTSVDFEVVGREVLVEDGSTLKTGSVYMLIEL